MAVFSNSAVAAMFIAVLTMQAMTLIAMIPLSRKVVTNDELEQRFTRHERTKHQ